MKKILYLHGLESSQGGKKVEFLSSQGAVYAPKIDYQNLNVNDFLHTIGTPDLVVGSSMGGYLADIVGSQFGCEVILLNPAFHSRTIDFNFEKGNLPYKRSIMLGMQDTEIPPLITMKHFINEDDNLTLLNDCGHRIPFSNFVNIYNKIVD